MFYTARICSVISFVLVATFVGTALSQEAAPEAQPPKHAFAPPPGAVRLSKTDPVWIDTKRKVVFVDGVVAMREGPPLEMLACPTGTKEHESIIAIFARPLFVHAGLLRIGAKVGNTVQFDPKYKAATGTRVDVMVQWMDENGRHHKVPGQHWVRHIRTGKALEHPWVFAGSSFWVDEESGEKKYNGDSGDFICVANFPTATLDLPISSSQANADLLYEAFTERIPPKGTHVRLVLIPRIDKMPHVEADEEKKE